MDELHCSLPHLYEREAKVGKPGRKEEKNGEKGRICPHMNEVLL